MSEVKVNKITPTADCGTVTLGDSGDTVAIPAGVTLTSGGALQNSGTITNTGTITGVAITGTIDNQVNWQTTVKTTGFTATAGEGYFCDTTSAAFTVTLPASPSAGDLVGIKDYANTADTNNITIGRNGSNIEGVANDFLINIEGGSITLIYVDATKGWLSTAAAKASDISNPQFTVATGGTITTCGDFKIHTFTGPGTFTVTQIGNAPTVPSGGPSNVDYLVVAGGAGGGQSGGGGGAGGYRTTFPSPGCNAGAFPVTATAFPITVGGGGFGGGGFPAPSNQGGPGFAGSDSVFSTITSTTGGGGGGYNNTAGNGGSGGGGGMNAQPGGSGNTPPVSPPQGNNGGPGVGSGADGSGGGGGASAVGGTGVPASQSGVGGAGSPNSITGSAVTYAGGGGGGGRDQGPIGESQPGAGGAGGGGAGGDGSPITSGVSGTANTGGGGGGSGFTGVGGGPGIFGGSGGSGIVIIRYKYQ